MNRLNKILVTISSGLLTVLFAVLTSSMMHNNVPFRTVLAGALVTILFLAITIYYTKNINE